MSPSPSSNTGGSTSGVQKRFAISERQRQALRRTKLANIVWTQEQLREWFRQEYGRSISQSSVAETLSKRYDYLDGETIPRSKPVVYRQTQPNHPALEKALIEHVDMMNRKKLNVSGDMIMEAAKRLWSLMPEYREVPEPKWSVGWLSGFKKRYKIKSRSLHGDAESVDVEGAQERLLEVQNIVATYERKKVFNCDETGLFWKMTPRRTLSRFSRKGTKEDKVRITAHLTANADGTEKLLPWIIGKSKNPRCFGKKRKNIQGIPMMYHFNNKSWMNGAIFEEYLQWFDAQFPGRKVLLLMDSFSAHESALEALERGDKALRNTRVEFLPKNATSLYQPLDQGIIRNTKVHYRRHWMKYILNLTMDGKDPIAEVTLLHALWWFTEAWLKEVKPETIANCWWKSAILGERRESTSNSNDWDDAFGEILQMAEAMNVQDTEEELADFINPAEEQVEDIEDQLAHLAEVYSEVTLPEEEQDKEDGTLENVMTQEGVDALDRYILYEKQQGDLSFDRILTLEKRLRALRTKLNEEKCKQKKQSSLDSWLI